MSTNSHVIGITDPQENRRIQDRRKSDISDRMKAARFDQLILDAQFQFEFWSKLCHQSIFPANVGYYEGQAHVWSRVLWYADLKPVCPCNSCTTERIREKEKPIIISGAEACEKTGEQ